MHNEYHGPSEKQFEIAKKKGYQDSDVSLPTLAQWSIGLIILVAAGAFIAVIILRAVQSPLLSPPEPANTALVQDDRRTLPANVPIIQDKPIPDIKIYREDEEKKLIEYAKIDGKNRIPLERAMEIVSEKGLPIQKPGEPATGAPLTPDMKPKPIVR